MTDINNIKSLSQADLASSRLNTARDNKSNASAASPAAPVNATDTVSLTDTAAQLQSVQQIIADTPIVDDARVAALKAAIEDGSYTVNADELAQNLLRSEFELR